MENESSVAILERASIMLAEANTIQKAKELKNLALTAADWAKHKKLGNKAIQHCRAYALEAERKIGGMLEATERAKGKLKQNTAVTSCNHGAPTLEELGLSKRESSDAQVLASLPQASFDAVRDGKKSLAQVRKEIKDAAPKDDLSRPPSPPAVEKDPHGKTIPSKLLPLWARRQEIQDILTSISRIKAAINHEKDPLFAELNISYANAHLDQAYTAVKATKPYCVCPYCQGEGCRGCRHRGLIGKDRFDTAPRELKQ